MGGLGAQLPTGTSRAPEGAARYRQLNFAPGFTGIVDGRAVSRGDYAPNAPPADGSNLGFSGEGTTFLASYKGTWGLRYRGGAQKWFPDQVPIQVARPKWATWYPDPALHVISIVMAWPSGDPVNGDSGLVLCYNGFSRVKSAINPGIMLAAAGLHRRSGAGLLTTGWNVAGFDPIDTTEWNRFRVELRQPTKNADGSVRVYVNDDAGPRISFSTVDGNYPDDSVTGGSSGFRILTMMADSAIYLYMKWLTYYCGPDIPNL